MAKVTLPCLGVSAHGMLAGQLVYRHRLGETTAGVWKGKRDAKTEAQLARRRMFWEAKEIWPDVDPALKAEYAAAAAGHIESRTAGRSARCGGCLLPANAAQCEVPLAPEASIGVCAERSV